MGRGEIMKKMLNFSIITPTYKNPEEFRKFLISLVGTEKPGNFELLVVDDSQNNEIEAIIEEFRDKIEIVFLKSKKRMFIGEKRNWGAHKSHYELLFFIDSDIILEKNALSVLIETMRKNKSAAMFGGKIIQGGKQLHPTKQDRLMHVSDNNYYVEVLYSAYLALYKTIFLKIGGYDKIFENRGEGTDLSIRFWRGGYPIMRNLDSVVYHPAFKPQRKTPEKIAEMYRSLFLVSVKYGLDPEKNLHFIEMYHERKDAYGEKCEFYVIYAFSLYYDWFCKNYKSIMKSKNEIPMDFDFKPFDIFTDQNLLKNCLSTSGEKIKPHYQKVFGGQ